MRKKRQTKNLAKGEERNFSIHNNTKEPIPRIPFEKIKDKVLGKNYSLSLVFIGDKLSRRLNREYRKKDRPTDILSFPLEDNYGEMFINLNKSRQKSADFNRSYKNYLGFLFIHGLVHLKGFEHSSNMENEEKKYRKIFGI